MADYTDSAACKMLATHCCSCGKELTDAVSVEAGMGPDCRKKYMKVVGVSEAARGVANKIVYEIALKQTGLVVLEGAAKLKALGFEKLAARIVDRCATVIVEEKGEVLAVYTPYSESVVFAMKSIPGRKWVKEEKVNTFPKSARAALLAVFKKNFPGALGMGPKGPFVVPA